MTDKEAEALREYLQKGGFVIVDDFKAQGDFGSSGWVRFEENMRKVIPEGRFVEMDTSRPSSAACSRTTTRTSACR